MSFPPVGSGAAHCAGGGSNGTDNSRRAPSPARRASASISRHPAADHMRRGGPVGSCPQQRRQPAAALSGDAAGSLAVSALGPRAQAGPPPLLLAGAARLRLNATN